MSQPINPMIPSLSQGVMPQPHHKTSNFDKLIMKLQVALPKYDRYAPKTLQISAIHLKMNKDELIGKEIYKSGQTDRTCFWLQSGLYPTDSGAADQQRGVPVWDDPGWDRVPDHHPGPSLRETAGEEPLCSSHPTPGQFPQKLWEGNKHHQKPQGGNSRLHLFCVLRNREKFMQHLDSYNYSCTYMGQLKAWWLKFI